MINIDKLEEKKIAAGNYFYPFRTADICGLTIQAGTCSVCLDCGDSYLHLEDLATNGFLFSEEFHKEQREKIALTGQEDFTLRLINHQQKDSLQFNYLMLQNYAQRIRNVRQKQSSELSVILIPQSKCSQKAFNGSYQVLFDKFPIQVGRFTKRRFGFPYMKNDFSLFDKKPFQVSRVHFRIEKRADGFYYRDLKSKLGSWVNGMQLNKTTRLEMKLKQGENKILLGKKSSEIIISLLVNY